MEKETLQAALKGAEKIVAYTAGNSQLLIDYRAALIHAYKLGQDIKEIYGIVPPKVISDDQWVLFGETRGNNISIGLTVN